MGKFKTFLKENEDILQQIFDTLDELSEEELDDFGRLLVDEFLELDPTSDEEDPDEDNIYDIDDVKDMIAELGYDFYDDVLDLLEPEEYDNDDDGEYIEGEPEEFQMQDDYAQVTEACEIRLEIYEEKGDAKAYQAFLKKAIAKFGGTGVDFDSVPKDKRDELGDYIDKNWESDDEEAGIDEAVSRRLKAKNRNRKKRKFQKKSVSQLRRGKAQRKVQARKDKPKKKRYFKQNKKKIQAYKKSRKKAIDKGQHKVKIRRK